jgi:hypothetical protein
MAHGVYELPCIENIFKNLEIKYKKPMDLHCDNKAVIEITYNLVRHDRTKI